MLIQIQVTIKSVSIKSVRLNWPLLIRSLLNHGFLEKEVLNDEYSKRKKFVKPADLRKSRTLVPHKSSKPHDALTQEKIYSKSKTYYDQFKEHSNANYFKF